MHKILGIWMEDVLSMFAIMAMQRNKTKTLFKRTLWRLRYLRVRYVVLMIFHVNIEKFGKILICNQSPSKMEQFSFWTFCQKLKINPWSLSPWLPRFYSIITRSRQASIFYIAAGLPSLAQPPWTKIQIVVTFTLVFPLNVKNGCSPCSWWNW